MRSPYTASKKTRMRSRTLLSTSLPRWIWRSWSEPSAGQGHKLGLHGELKLEHPLFFSIIDNLTRTRREDTRTHSRTLLSISLPCWIWFSWSELLVDQGHELGPHGERKLEHPLLSCSRSSTISLGGKIGVHVYGAL